MKITVSTDAASMTNRWQHPTTAFSEEIHLRKQNLMDLNSDPSPTLKNKRSTSKKKNLTDLDRSHRRQVCESSSHCNSLNDLRQITQNLVCRGLVSSGNQDVASTTQRLTAPKLPPQPKRSTSGIGNWWISTKLTHQVSKEPVSIQWWFHRNHLMEGQPILISAGS